MIGSTLDRMISVFSPQWGLERMAARASLSQIEAFASSSGGYAAGKLNRLTKGRLGSSVKEHAIPTEEVARLRWQSWQLWRNNPYARKIVRNICAQVVGKNGLRPRSTATRPDGSPHVEFIARAAELWKHLKKGFDFRGMPGRGGLTLPQLQRLMLASIVLSGETLNQSRPITTQEMKKRNLPIPLTVQLIDADRLASEAVKYVTESGNEVYRGIEVDRDGRRVAYHLHDYPLGDSDPRAGEPKRISAEKIRHVYIEEDIDQYRGVSWFAPNLLQMRDVGDYQYNELKASAMAACVVLGYKLPSGRRQFGVQPQQGSPSGDDTTDEDGNQVSRIQPGMFVDLGTDGKLEGFNPMRPGANAEAFIQHMLRATAGGFPGVKSSTVTGDYRGSSFSSERSADNDAWPELEAVQEWFSEIAMQPIYEDAIVAAIGAGWFNGIVTPAEFMSRRANFLGADWQGPVARSINPTDDADAAGLRVKYGQSSPQIECAARGHDWQEILRQVAEFRTFAIETLKLPEEVVNNMLSVDSQDVIDRAVQSAKKSGDAAVKRYWSDRRAAVPRRAAGPFDSDDIEEPEEDDVAEIGMEAAHA